ncbi:MAG TPA: hypothetical protein VK249_19220 [Anaerolineales bacterium]|nr:hypothetical protein [Anaerolineales bacterium]
MTNKMLKVLFFIVVSPEKQIQKELPNSLRYRRWGGDGEAIGRGVLVDVGAVVGTKTGLAVEVDRVEVSVCSMVGRNLTQRDSLPEGR